jgi:hypothetical protein
MGTKFSDYLAESEAADTPEDAAVRAMFAAGIALGLQFRDARVSRGLTQAALSGLTGIPQAQRFRSGTVRAVTGCVSQAAGREGCLAGRGGRHDGDHPG